MLLENARNAQTFKNSKKNFSRRGALCGKGEEPL
jgi:hypothetical protein